MHIAAGMHEPSTLRPGLRAALAIAAAVSMVSRSSLAAERFEPREPVASLATMQSNQAVTPPEVDAPAFLTEELAVAGPELSLHEAESEAAERPGVPLTPAQIARQALPAVVQVVSYGRDRESLRRGSGFIVGAEGLVLTSHHVLRDARSVEVITSEGEIYEVVSVSGEDLRHDLAVLRIAGFGLPVLELGETTGIEVGEPVTVIGSPLGLANTVSNGLLSAQREMEGSRVLQISAPISTGSSGGPVFDSRGRVIGILAGYYPRGQNVNFAVPIEYARGLLDVPDRALTVLAVGRKNSRLLGDGDGRQRVLSLEAVLRGERVDGEDVTAWALQPRRVDLEAVKGNAVRGPSELVGLWEIRELSRVPDTKSGVYRGIWASDGVSLEGTFFGTLVPGTDFDRTFRAEWLREFSGDVEPGGRATLRGEHGCTYYVHAAADGMVGVYECVDDRGRVYDLGAVEAVRIEGAGPSGVYDYREEVSLRSRHRVLHGTAVVYGLPDGRWTGKLMQEIDGFVRVLALADGRWTADGYLSTFVHDENGPKALGRFDPRQIRMRYPIGGRDYDDMAKLEAKRRQAP